MRITSKGQVTIPVDIREQAGLPPLTLQPLLENAIYHGIENLEDGGTIQIQGRYREGLIILSIRNPLPPEESVKVRSGHQMAVDNVRERLHFAFGRKGQVHLTNTEDLFNVVLTFPGED